MAFIPGDAVIPEGLNMEVFFLVFNFWIRWRIFPIKRIGEIRTEVGCMYDWMDTPIFR